MSEGSNLDRRNTHVVAVHEIKVHKVTARDKNLQPDQHPSPRPIPREAHSQEPIKLNHPKLAMRTPRKLSS